MTPETIGIFALGVIAGILLLGINMKYHEWMESRETCSKCGNYI